MFLKIQDLNGHVVKVDIDLKMTVKTLKEGINDRLGYKNDQYRIYHYNDFMEETKKIGDYNVSEGDTLTLVIPYELDNREHPRWVF